MTRFRGSSDTQHLGMPGAQAPLTYRDMIVWFWLRSPNNNNYNNALNAGSAVDNNNVNNDNAVRPA